MYQTSRSQRAFWSNSRKQLQQERRAENIKTKINQDNRVVTNGAMKIRSLHRMFLERAGLIKKQNLI